MTITTIDPYEGYARSHPGCPDNAIAVTPSDTDDLPVVASAIWVASGLVRVLTKGGQTVDFQLPSPAIIPVRVVRVFATGTTAASIVALW